MEKVRLGRTGVEVSVVGLGCGGSSRLGMARGADRESAAALVRRAIDLGVTLIDTARAYGTEEAVGEAIQGRRAALFLSSKAGAQRGDHFLTAAEFAGVIDESLRRLRTDYIDLYHLHGVAPNHYEHCVSALLPELERQRAAGKIRFIGITERFGSDTGHAMLERALTGDLFDVVMTGFNLLNPSARHRVFSRTRERDVGTLIMFAVRRSLSDSEALRQTVAGLVRRGEVAAELVDLADPLAFVRETGASTLVEAAYRFCRHEPGTHVILTGTGNPDHLEENIAAIQASPLPAAVLAKLERLFGSVDSVSGN